MDKYINQSITLNSTAEPTLPWIMDGQLYVYSAYPLVVKLNVMDTPLFTSTVYLDGESFAESEFRVNPAESIATQIRYAILVCEDVLYRICDIQTWNTAHHTFLSHCYYSVPTEGQIQAYHEAVSQLRNETIIFYEEHILQQEDDDDVTE